MKKINRFEYIIGYERKIIEYGSNLQYELQDNGKTLKVFLDCDFINEKED